MRAGDRVGSAEAVAGHVAGVRFIRFEDLPVDVEAETRVAHEVVARLELPLPVRDPALGGALGLCLKVKEVF